VVELFPIIQVARVPSPALQEKNRTRNNFYNFQNESAMRETVLISVYESWHLDIELNSKKEHVLFPNMKNIPQLYKNFLNCLDNFRRPISQQAVDSRGNC
jgi:hypothetical protein